MKLIDGFDSNYRYILVAARRARQLQGGAPPVIDTQSRKPCRIAQDEIKAGKVEFRADKTSLVHVPVGKLSFDSQKLIDNATTVITSIVRAKPSAAKGKYIKSITISSTMGPGVPLDQAVADAAGKH